MQFTLASSALIALLLCSVRCIAWMTIAPPIATGGVPAPIKVIFGVALGMALVPATQAHVPQPELLPVAGALLVQLGVGAGLGFLTRLLFSAIESAGSAIDLFGGFSAAATYNPFSGAPTAIFGSFYSLMCTTLIFATDAHLVIFGGFIRSFTTVPLDGTFDMSSFSKVITTGVTQMFLAALQIAGPLIVVLFIADVAMGILNRIAPQLNAFALSFPLKIGLTLLLVGIGFALMPQTVVDTADRVNDMIAQVTG